MNLKRFSGFVKKASESSNPFVRHQGLRTQQAMMEHQEDEAVSVSELSHPNKALSQNKLVAVEDKLFQEAMPEIYAPDTNDKSLFGKGDVGHNAANASQPAPIIQVNQASQASQPVNFIKGVIKKESSLLTRLKMKYGRRNHNR